jgi:predicted ester cyclase
MTITSSNESPSATVTTQEETPLATITSEENITLFRRAVEIVWNGDLERAGEFFAADVIVHHPIQKEPFYGLEGFKQFPRMLRQGFPDLNVTIERVISDGDRIGARWVIHGTHTGTFPLLPLRPTGRRITLPVNEILHVRDGKLAELWLELNILSVAQQLGVLPPLEKLPPALLKIVGRLQQLRRPPRPVVGVLAVTMIGLVARRALSHQRR